MLNLYLCVYGADKYDKNKNVKKSTTYNNTFDYNTNLWKDNLDNKLITWFELYEIELDPLLKTATLTNHCSYSNIKNPPRFINE